MTTEKREHRKKGARRDDLLAASIAIALETGFNSLTRDGIADRAGVSAGQVNHTFNTMVQLRRAVMRAAVSRELLPIVAQGVAMGDKVACNAPEELQQRALQSLVKG